MNRYTHHGFTLIELSISTAILIVLMSILLSMFTGMTRTSSTQNAQIIADDDVRLAILRLDKELRLARWESVVVSATNDSLSYRMPSDQDGNGITLDSELRLENSSIRTLSRDVSDLNGDGLSLTQLILNIDGQITVLANKLTLNEDSNGNNVLDSGEDLNGNGKLELGFYVSKEAKGIHLVLESNKTPSSQGRIAISRVEQIIIPRN